MDSFGAQESTLLIDLEGFWLLDCGYERIQPLVERVDSVAEFIERNQDVPRLIFIKDTSELDEAFITDSERTRSIYNSLVDSDTLV